MTNHDATRETIRQLRAHEERDRGSSMSNMAGNCADIIQIQLRQIERLEGERIRAFVLLDNFDVDGAMELLRP